MKNEFVTVKREVLEQALDTMDSVVLSYGTPRHEIETLCDLKKELRAALEQPWMEPVKWEWRWFDANPNTVTFGQWSEWKQVEPRNALCTVEDSLNEFRAYIANGQKYELRPLYTATQAQQPAQPQELTASEVALMWVNESFDTMTHESCYVRGVKRGEEAVWLKLGLGGPQPAQQPDTRTAAIQACIDRLIQGGKPAEAGMLRHHFAKDLGEE